MTGIQYSATGRGEVPPPRDGASRVKIQRLFISGELVTRWKPGNSQVTVTGIEYNGPMWGFKDSTIGQVVVPIARALATTIENSFPNPQRK